LGKENLQPRDLIATARLLANSGQGKPAQVHLRRAISTAYYALFHTLARNGADLLIGGHGAAHSKHAWRQVYRALEHGVAKNACQNRAIVSQFPRPIEDFASTFVDMQIRRHDADYDPIGKYTKSEVLKDIDDIETAIAGFLSAPRKDRQAFSAYVLMKTRP